MIDFKEKTSVLCEPTSEETYIEANEALHNNLNRLDFFCIIMHGGTYELAGKNQRKLLKREQFN